MGFLTSFIFYDLALLVIFILLSIYFLHKNRANLERQGIIYLYRAKWGIKLIDYIGTKYKKTLNVLSYFSVGIGYVLMAAMIYLFAQAIYVYIRFPQITEVVRAPPIVPIFPYFTNVFGLESFFPPFYFTYFIIAVSFAALVHEFAHGIFAKVNKLRIDSTGLAFLGPILGAFVEPDEKQMPKKPIFAQLSILSAGVFANAIFAFVFYVILVLFFTSFFVAGGVLFTGYATGVIDSSHVTSIEGFALDDLTDEEVLELIEENNIENKAVGNFNLTEITVGNETVFIPIENLKFVYSEPRGSASVLLNSPAIQAGMPLVDPLTKGSIVEIDGVAINNYDQLGEEIRKHSPGSEIEVKVRFRDEIQSYNVELQEHPNIEGASYLGVTSQVNERGVFGKLLATLNFYKDPRIDYEPNGNVATIQLIHDFLWWMMVLNLLIALFNMLPLGILDGGRFFYLTVLAITKSDKLAKKSFAAITYGILILLAVIMLIWFYQIFL